jgi:TPR repeat protein
VSKVSSNRGKAEQQALLKDEFLDRAYKEWDEGHDSKAFELFMAAAKAGDHRSLNSIGYFLNHGIGVEKNSDGALRWYKKAAKHGDRAGIANLGLTYQERGDVRRARYWQRRAYSSDDGDSALDLAKIYLEQPSRRNELIAYRLLRETISATYVSDDAMETATKLLNGIRPPRGDLSNALEAS